MDIAALTTEEMAELLQVEPEVVQRHIEQGAPAAADGTLNLVVYAAWLNRRLQGKEGKD